MKKYLKIETLYLIFAVLAAFLLPASILYGYRVSKVQLDNTYTQKSEDSTVSPLLDLNDGWLLHHENGQTESISLPYEVQSDESTILITHDIRGILQADDVIKFDNLRQGVIVSVNNENIYAVNTTHLNRQLSFTDYQLVTIPDTSDISELSLQFTHKIAEHYTLPAISYGSYHAASNEILGNDILTLNLLVILTLVLVASLMITVFCFVNKISVARSLELAIFTLAAILWGLTDSYLPILFGWPQEVLGLICYYSIMTVPIPMCQFVWRSCQKKYSVFPVISTIGVVNLLLQAILSSLGILQLQNTFYTAHILILAVICASVISIYKTRKTLHSLEMNILYLGIVILAGMAMVSLILYWQKGGLYYRNCMLIGILFFTLILCAYVILHYVEGLHATQLAVSEVKIHERLSLLDELTGLPNRRSFEKKMDEIEQKIQELDDVLLIMLDVNGLKLVNDQYGHTAGDDLIVSASKVIQMTYGNFGNCYRIGGDEFAVILSNFSIPLSTYDRVFEENISDFNKNSRWKLSIAKGCSHLLNSCGQRLTISDWKQEADINMYRNKVSMTNGNSRDRAKDFSDIIKCIISTVEAKDVYTAAHSDRVRELSYCIASNLGVSDSTLQRLEMAATLHDIGKVGIPDYILLKPDRLTNEEYEIIKEHSLIGSNIIGHAKGMQEISNIILHHHERWDGKGYPSGLSKEDIPMESRIIALADSIDAMTSRRVYRDSMSLDSCRAEIKKNSGIMYDPAITQIVLQNWNKIVDIIMIHPKRLINE